jgi:hypothetical protein
VALNIYKKKTQKEHFNSCRLLWCNTIVLFSNILNYRLCNLDNENFDESSLISCSGSHVGPSPRGAADRLSTWHITSKTRWLLDLDKELSYKNHYNFLTADAVLIETFLWFLCNSKVGNIFDSESVKKKIFTLLLYDYLV